MGIFSDLFDICSIDDTAINPGSGLPMVGGSCGSIDVAGNTFGSDSSTDLSMDDPFCSDISDAIGCNDMFDT